MATTTVTTRPVVGSDTKWTVRVNGKQAGWVELSSRDGLYVALVVGRALGRFAHKQQAVDSIREHVA